MSRCLCLYPCELLIVPASRCTLRQTCGTSLHLDPRAGRTSLPPLPFSTCADTSVLSLFMSEPRSSYQKLISVLSIIHASPSHSLTPSFPNNPHSSLNSLGRLPHSLHPRGLGLCHLGPDLHHGGRLRRLPAPALRPEYQGTSIASLPPSLPPPPFQSRSLTHLSLPSLPPPLPCRPSKRAWGPGGF
jgi:hypothetical protein